MEREELLALGVEEEIVDRIVDEQEKMREDYESRISSVQRDYEIENLLVQSGARNTKAVRALLGDGDVNSIREELENLKNGEDTKFLFEKKGSFVPARSGERLPDAKKMGYEERLAEARRAGKTIEAIRIKQQAAGEGVMLI